MQAKTLSHNLEGKSEKRGTGEGKVKLHALLERVMKSYVAIIEERNHLVYSGTK